MPRSQPRGGSSAGFAFRNKYQQAIADQCRGHTADSRLMLPSHVYRQSEFTLRKKYRYALATYAPVTRGKQKADGFPSAFLLEKICYFAYSTRLTSLITFTLICPGYSSSASSFFAISFAMNMVFESSISSGFTMTLISLPA